MYIKEEPLDEEVEVKEELFADYRTQVKVEIETDSDDSSDEEDSPANIKVEDVKEESEHFLYHVSTRRARILYGLCSGTVEQMRPTV